MFQGRWDGSKLLRIFGGGIGRNIFQGRWDGSKVHCPPKCLYLGGLCLSSEYSCMSHCDVTQESLRMFEVWSADTKHITCYRAADVEPTCRFVLERHAQCSQPQHVFGDLMERVDIKTARALRSIVQAGIRSWQRQRGRGMLGKSKKKNPASVKKTLSQSVFRKCLACLKSATYHKKRYCFRCARECEVHPPAEERSEHSHYIVVAGTTCVSWSSMGSCDAWLHQATLPFMVWLEDWYRHEPTHVIHECSRNFDVESFREAVSEKYHLEQVISSPLDFGVPAHRCRSYCLLTLKSKIVVDIPYSRASLSELLFQKVATNAKIFFRAPSSLVNSYCVAHERADRKDEDDTPARKCLTKSAL